MSFFEPPPPRRPRDHEPPEPPARPWWGAPRNELGAPVPLRLVLARTERVAVAVVGVTAYTSGVEFRLAVRRRPRPSRHLSDEEADDFFYDDPFEHPFGWPRRRMRRGRELPPELLRFGVQFSDGRKATTVGDMFPGDFAGEEEHEQEPAGPVLAQRGGGGGGGEWQSEFWLWPIPPPGSVAFVVEWPAEGIELTRQEVAAALFKEASAKSEVLWAETRTSDGSWRSYGGISEVRALGVRPGTDEDAAPERDQQNRKR